MCSRRSSRTACQPGTAPLRCGLRRSAWSPSPSRSTMASMGRDALISSLQRASSACKLHAPHWLPVSWSCRLRTTGPAGQHAASLVCADALGEERCRARAEQERGASAWWCTWTWASVRLAMARSTQAASAVTPLLGPPLSGCISQLVVSAPYRMSATALSRCWPVHQAASAGSARQHATQAAPQRIRGPGPTGVHCLHTERRGWGSTDAAHRCASACGPAAWASPRPPQ